VHSLAPLPVALPLLTAALLAALGHLVPARVRDSIAIAAAAATAATSAALLYGSADGVVVHWFGGWAPRGGTALGVAFVVDPLGAGAATLAGVLAVAALVYSWTYLHEAGHLYPVLTLIFLSGMCGVALTGDLFNLFVFFELMSVSAFALTGFHIEELGPLQGAFVFAVTNTIAAFLVLLGTGMLYGRFGVLNLAQLGEMVGSAPLGGLAVVSFTLLTCGFLVKAAVVPFHLWLADAHAVAPAPVCVLFSGIMVELGLLATARVYWTIFAPAFEPHAPSLRVALVGIGVVTALGGATMALLQRHLKRLLAFSTISHAGILVCGVGLLEPRALGGVAEYVLAHGLLKGGLFLVAGILLATLGSVDELELRGRGRALPAAGIVWLVAAIVLAGPPFLGPFRGKAEIDEAATAAGLGWLPAVLALASALATAAVLRAGLRVFLGAGLARDDLLSRQPGESAPGDPGRRSVPRMLLPAALLVAAGTFASMLPDLSRAAERAAEQFTDTSRYSAAVLHGTASPVPLPPGHPMHASAVLLSLATVAGALLVAGLLLHRQRVSAPLRRLLQPLRSLHSGHVGDAVSFLAFGVAAFGGLFALALR
jgi:multicomponent Na+:H+ antiporter subunit D